MQDEEYDLSEFGAIPEEEYDLSEFGAVPIAANQKNSNVDNNMLSKILNGIYDYSKDAANSGINFTLGAGDALVNLPKGLANMLTPQSMQVPLSKSGEGFAYDAGHIGGDIAGFIGGGSALNSARLASSAIPYAGKLAQALSGNGLRGIGRRAIGGSLYGAIQDPENRLQGAGIGGGASVASDALLGSLSKFLPRNFIKSNLSPEELKYNLEVAKDTNTPLGDVIESPSTKGFYENFLNKIYGSGIDDATGKVEEHIKNKAEELLKKYLGENDPDNAAYRLGEMLREAYESNKLKKQELYSIVNDLSERHGLTIDLPEFSGLASKFSDIINESTLLKFEPEAKELLSRLTNYKNPSSEKSILLPDGTKYMETIPTSLKEANILSGKLYDIYKKLNASPVASDRAQASVFKNLYKTLKNDIDSSIEKSGNADIKKAYSIAQKNYKENFSQFLDDDIYKFLGGGESPEKILSHFIRTGRTNDHASMISKLMSVLPEEGQNLVRSSYLSRAIEGAEDARQVNPNKLSTNWTDSKLGQNQKKALFPEKADRQELDDYVKLVKMNPNALNRMFNSKTGQRNTEVMSLLRSMGAGAAAGSSIAGPVGAVLGALGGPMTFGTAAKIPANFLHSPSYREKIVNNLINKKNNVNKGIDKSNKYSDALKSSLIDLFTQ